jgi:hypothetical protein
MSGIDLAATLYGSGNPDPELNPEIVTPPSGDQPIKSIAQTLYGEAPKYGGDKNAPADVQAARAADQARQMYSPQRFFADALPDAAIAGLDHAAAREVLGDLQAAPEDAAQLVALVNNDEDDGATWQAQSAQFIKDNGLTESQLNDARRLVARDPRVKEFLDNTGLGNHPKVVARVVELARAAKLRGQL